MLESAVNQPRIPNAGARRFAVDAGALVVYLVVVYAASLWLRPLGRDFGALAEPMSLPPIADRLFAWEVAAFGSWPVGYHLVNLGLLYGCMLSLYRFVRLTIPGPFWLGTLAATLFMANPVHSEAVLNLSGVGDVAPAFFALAALALYAEHGLRHRYWSYAVALGAFMLAVLPYRENVGLVIALGLYEAFCLESTRRFVRLLPFVVVAAASLELNGGGGAVAVGSFGEMFAPLYLIFYPIGLLPETVRTFSEHPWLGWVSGAAVLFVLALIYGKARRPVIAFGLLSMVGVRLFHEGAVDLVHMIGGGVLLVPNALFNVALVGLFYRIAGHPKWRRPVIMATTLLAVFFFALQIVYIVRWRDAARLVDRLQSAASVSAAPVGLIPDYRAYRGAPVALSEAVSYDTPFSRRVDHVSMLPLDYVPPEEHFVQLESSEMPEMLCLVEAEPLVKVVPYPFGLLEPGNVVRTPDAAIEVGEIGEGRAVFRIRPDRAPGSFVCVRTALSPATAETAAAEAVSAASEPEPAPEPAAAGERGATMPTDNDRLLTPEQRQALDSAGWVDRVGDGLGVWVSIGEQKLRVIEGDEIAWQADCSTAKNGPGFGLNSFKTPLGWHSVAEKIGEDAPWGQVFREKRAVRHVWEPGKKTSEDLVLTRILALAGEEPGVNKGGDVDSYRRCIYIHGTNDEEEIGQPVSHGCIRLKNDDVIEAFERIGLRTPVLIAR